MDERFATVYHEAAPAGHWWFAGRSGLIAELLEANGYDGGMVADVGGGGTTMFPDTFEVVRLDACHPGRSDGNPFVRADGHRLPIRSGSLDGVGLFDVLEHTARPKDLLAEARRITRPDGFLVATVPAHQWLWSRHDELAGHIRRYTSAGLVRLLSEGGYRAHWVGPFFGFLVPAALVRKSLGWTHAFSLPPRPINGLLAATARRSGRRALRSPGRLGLSIGALGVPA